MFKIITKHLYKILVILCLLLSLTSIYLQYETKSKSTNVRGNVTPQIQHIEELKNYDIKTNINIADLTSFSNHLLSHINSLERKNYVLENALLNMPQNGKNSDTLKEKICNSIIEDSINPAEISEGYHCLALLQLKQKDLASIYQAIRYESFALEASYNEKYLKSLITIITGTDKTIKITPEFNEYEYITILSNSNNPEVSSKALYRMSLINSLGRSSSLQETHKYNLVEASMLKNKVLSIVKSFKRKTVDVLFTINNNSKYVNWAKTAIASILLNADLNSDYNFYFITDPNDPISNKNHELLDSLHKIGSYKLHFIHTNQILFDKKNNSFFDNNIQIAIQRFFVENTLDNLNSIIYLDTDLIVLRDLYDLQHKTDLSHNIFAAAIENMILYRKNSCGFSYSYSNIGVVVENLKLMRETKNANYLVDKYRKLLTNIQKECLLIPDQDIFNIVYKNKIKFLSQRWNYLPTMDFSTKFMPFIIHFAGGQKPSKETLKPEHLLYFEYEKLANS